MSDFCHERKRHKPVQKVAAPPSAPITDAERSPEGDLQKSATVHCTNIDCNRGPKCLRMHRERGEGTSAGRSSSAEAAVDRKHRRPLPLPPLDAVQKSTTERFGAGVTLRREVYETLRGKRFTVEPGHIGIDINWDTGAVQRVREGSQAAQLGIKPYMMVKVVDGAPFSESALRSKVTGEAPYKLTLDWVGRTVANWVENEASGTPEQPGESRDANALRERPDESQDADASLEQSQPVAGAASLLAAKMAGVRAAEWLVEKIPMTRSLRSGKRS